jgi:hypothetical protein
MKRKAASSTSRPSTSRPQERPSLYSFQQQQQQQYQPSYYQPAQQPFIYPAAAAAAVQPSYYYQPYHQFFPAAQSHQPFSSQPASSQPLHQEPKHQLQSQPLHQEPKQLHYEILDSLDRPFGTKGLALDTAKSLFGSRLKQTFADNNNDGHYHVYECENKAHCALRVKLQQMGGEQGSWMVMVGKGETNDGRPKYEHSSHHHCASEGILAHGLTHDVKGIIDAAFPLGISKQMSRGTLLDHVHQFLLDHASEEYNLIASTPDKYEPFKLQVGDYLKNMKKKNAPPPAASPGDLRDTCQKQALRIPDSYVPRADYESAEQLAQALGKPVNACLLTHLGSGKPMELYKAHQEKENKARTKKEGPTKLSAQQQELLGALVVYSPATLFKLLEGGRGPKGTRFRGHDGTHGCIGNHQLITNALHEFRYRDSQGKPTLSVVPTHWLIAREEWKSAVVACDLIIQWLYKALFGVELELDFSVSDQAGGLREATHSVWGDRCMVLTCFFHVMQAIRDSLLPKFTDKAYKSGPGPSGKKKCSQGMKDVYLLHNCSTPEQFATCSELIVEQWTIDGQHEASKHLKNMYLAVRKEKWYFGASGKYICIYCESIHGANF